MKHQFSFLFYNVLQRRIYKYGLDVTARWARILRVVELESIRVVLFWGGGSVCLGLGLGVDVEY